MTAHADLASGPIAAPQPPLILVIDIGSSSTRAALYDATATLVPGTMVREKSAFYVAPDGTAEDDPRALLDRVVRCIDGALHAAGDLQRHIAAVSCASYASSLLGVDAAGAPLTPIYTYADTRSADTADMLRAQLDERAILQRTGCPLRASYLPAALTWLNHTQPDLARRVVRWSSIGEWLYTSFLGRSTITYSAAAWTGLLDRHTLHWDAPLLDTLHLDPSRLGTLADVDQPIEGLRAPWAERWPALSRVPWFAAIGDGAAANIGSGAIDPRYVALSIGTSGALRTVMDTQPSIPPGLWCYRVDRDRPLLGGATSEGGNVLVWALTTLRLRDVLVDRHLLDPRGAAHNLTVLPFIAGERSPGWSGDSTMSISGITRATQSIDIARAALEGVTYRWATIAALLRQSLPAAPTVVASGGAIGRIPAWAQLVADALGLPVAVSTEPETTSRGVALLTLRSLGTITSLADRPVTITPTHQPDPHRHAQHLEAIERQRALYGRVIGLL